MEPISLFSCQACGRRWQSPYAGCPYCGASTVGTIQTPGVGRIYSWVGVYRTVTEAHFEVPYVVVTVELEGGGRVFAKYEGQGEPTADQPVHCAIGQPDEGLRAFPAQ